MGEEGHKPKYKYYDFQVLKNIFIKSHHFLVSLLEQNIFKCMKTNTVNSGQ